MRRTIRDPQAFLFKSKWISSRDRSVIEYEELSSPIDGAVNFELSSLRLMVMEI